MPTRLVSVIFDALDHTALGRFWSEALGWRIAQSVLRHSDVDLEMWFIPTSGAKAEKNRVHLDIGQGEVPWVVLGDPEGNEFCVLTPR